MATQENIEYLAMLECKVELTSEISAHPLSVSTALVTKGLIPEQVHSYLLQQTKENEVKASEIKVYPPRFYDFLEVLRSYEWLENVLKTLISAYDELKQENKKGSDIEDVTATLTEGIN